VVFYLCYLALHVIKSSATLTKIYMKFPAAACFLLLLAFGCNRNDVLTKLLSEQKFLKDSANNIRERIGDYTQRNVYDSAEAQNKHLGAIHGRLIDIQFSIDSLAKMK
jgi:hypothetical protein